MSAFNQNFLFLRHPLGGVEDIAAMKAAGFTAVFCNVGDFSPVEWSTIRGRALMLGVTCGVWARTADANNNFEPHIVDRLTTIADSWNCPGIVNSESELKGSGNFYTSLIAQKVGTRDFAMSMEAIPFANVDWTPVAHLPMCPQMFIEAGDVDFTAVKELWHNYGVKCVYYTFGVVGRTSGYYNRKAPYSCYTADDMDQDYAGWSPTSFGYDCKEVADLLEAIGGQHGIAGFMKWLRAQPNVPQRGPGYNEEEIGTWPWPDKLERTLNILVKDHDSNE